MEFNRSTQSAAPRMAPSAAESAPLHAASGNKGGNNNKVWNANPLWLRIAWMILLVAGTVLVVLLLAALYFGGPKEQNYVDKNKEQAVFLQNGQVYFGKIHTVNKQYVDLQNIYYLNVNQQVQPNQTSSNSNSNSNQSVSLVKLGCELHGPTDEMVINRDQITFWENLKTDGQVSKAISQWLQQNPKGQTCTQSTSNTNSSNSTATTPSTSNTSKQ